MYESIISQGFASIETSAKEYTTLKTAKTKVIALHKIVLIDTQNNARTFQGMANASMKKNVHMIMINHPKKGNKQH